MALTLYHSPDSRSSRIIWLLEESGQPYTLAYVDIARRSGTGASDPRNPHPDKRVPALDDNGQLVTECAAIALSLAERFPEARLGPPPRTPLRASFLTWITFYPGEVEPAYASLVAGLTRSDPFLERAANRVAERVAGALERSPYLLGRDFSAADILVSGPFEWLPAFGNAHPAIGEWLKRLSDRPAAQRARDLDVPPAGISNLERRGDARQMPGAGRGAMPARFAGFR